MVVARLHPLLRSPQAPLLRGIAARHASSFSRPALTSTAAFGLKSRVKRAGSPLELRRASPSAFSSRAYSWTSWNPWSQAPVALTEKPEKPANPGSNAAAEKLPENVSPPSPAPGSSSSQLTATTDAPLSDAAILAELQTESSLQHLPGANEIGWLHSLGLDFGVGPSSVLQWTIEHIHVYSGMPWWGSIVMTGVLVRILLWIPTHYAHENNIKSAKLQDDPVYAELSARKKAMYSSGVRDIESLSIFQSQTRRMHKQAGVKPWLAFVPIAIQVPLGFAAWRVLRAMAAIPVPGLENGGLLWFSNLAEVDPYYVLPVVSPVMMYLTVKINQKYARPATAKNEMLVAKIGAVMSFTFTSWLPASVNIYLITTMFITSGQRVLQNAPFYRNLMGLPPIEIREDFGYQPPASVFADGIMKAPRKIIDSLRKTDFFQRSIESNRKKKIRAMEANLDKRREDETRAEWERRYRKP